MDTINQTELEQKIAEKLDIPVSQAEKNLKAISECIEECLKHGHDLRIAGLGIFEIKTRSARMGRNPQTGERLQVPAKRVVKIRPWKNLRDAVL